MNQTQLADAATALEKAAKQLDELRELIPDGMSDDKALRHAGDLLLGTLHNVIEAVGGVGEQVRETQNTLMKLSIGMRAVGTIALGEGPADRNPFQFHQCPECGLPIGTNTSLDGHYSGCITCHEALLHQLAEIREAAHVPIHCPDCNCKLGTNPQNCQRCALVRELNV